MTLTRRISDGLNLNAFYIQEHNSHKKTHFFNFFHSKALETKFDLAIKKAVGAGGGCLDIFILIYLFSPFSPSL